MMNRRQMMLLPGAAFLARYGFGQAPRAAAGTPADTAQVPPDQLLLKDYRPKSIFKIPVSDIKKAKGSLYWRAARNDVRASEV